MSLKIRLLSEETINQIAAGEVIEDPASVVKELVENSLDAGATRIRIETQGGGSQLIRVIDNGSGMSREDALLSLQRHATSKIVQVEDLFQLTTMGFRGEALASIAAISKMAVETSLGKDAGVRIEMEGGKQISIGVCARARGTTVEVRSLFYNVPARKKFQKSSSFTTSEITRVVTTLGLAYPEIEFHLMHQEREVLKMPRIEALNFEEVLKKRAEALLGQDFFGTPFTVAAKDHSFQIEGFIGSPMQTRNNRSGQHLFINQRAVFSPLISHAVKEAYGTRLPTNAHPLFLLHVRLPSSLIDVNVHPQKKEVRFQEGRLIGEKIREAVRLSLQKIQGEHSSLEEPFVPHLEGIDDLSPSLPVEGTFSRFFLREEGKLVQSELPARSKSPVALGVFSHYLFLEASSVAHQVQELVSSQEGEGLLLLDLLAARARISFHALLGKEGSSLDRQSLLLPLTFELPTADAQFFEANLDVVQRMGIEARALGNRCFLIDALPLFLEPCSAVEALLDLLEELRSFAKENLLEEQRVRRLALRICRFARADKRKIFLGEALALFEKLLQTDCPYQCPQGRATLIYLSSHEIEHFFSRKF